MSRVVRLASGFTLLGAGTAMLVLPGPGILTILGGLTVLSRDLPWAQRLTDQLKAKTSRKPR
ncbi:MAG TPA: PGPGW domain-containing protein [Acidimicrobiia bacterium]|nr:PGPGW domain-containing protein [Acidimicrobiia bacterium]